MPISQLIGGAPAGSGASIESESDSSGSSVSFDNFDNAGDVFRQYLNERTPEGVSWNLDFGFVASVLTGLSTVLSLLNWVR